MMPSRRLTRAFGCKTYHVPTLIAHMVADDLDRIEAELVANFKQLGLNKYEAQTLIGLYRLGSGTAKDIARVNDVPRTRVYDAAESLHELGLVDIQYSTPQKFSIVPRESLIRKLNLDREHTIQSVDELLTELEPTEPQREEFGVWTVSGRGSVSDRVREFIEEAEGRIVLMTIDELLTDTHIDALREAAEDRDVEVYIAGISPDSEARIRDEVPSVELFESLWEWSETPAGRLLVTDSETALVSALVDEHTTHVDEETAIWGRGERNSLVVVLRAIFTWRLESTALEPRSA